MLSHESRVFLLLLELLAQRQSGWVCCSQRVSSWWVMDRPWIEELVWWVSVYSWAQAVQPTIQQVVNPEEQLFFFCRRLHAVQVFLHLPWPAKFGSYLLVVEECHLPLRCVRPAFPAMYLFLQAFLPYSLLLVTVFPILFLWGGPVL